METISIKIKGAEIVYDCEEKVIEKLTIEPTDYIDLNAALKGTEAEQVKIIGKVYGKGVGTVVLPEWVTDVAAGVFSETDIRQVVWPTACDYIPHLAFWVSSIEEVKNIQGVKIIGMDAFFRCTNFKYFKIPEGVEEIPARCFSRSGLEKIEGTEKISFIDKEAFAESGLKGVFHWPQQCSVVKKGTFRGCYQLGEVADLQNITAVEDSAFAKMGGCLDSVRLDFSKSQCRDFGLYAFWDLDPDDVSLPVGMLCRA